MPAVFRQSGDGARLPRTARGRALESPVLQRVFGARERAPCAGVPPVTHEVSGGQRQAPAQPDATRVGSCLVPALRYMRAEYCDRRFAGLRQGGGRMLRRIRDLEGWTVDGRDAASVGTLHDFYFDDQRWAIRYFVIDTGSWLTGRRVLISPAGVESISWDSARLQLHLTRERVEHAPLVDWQQPISRRYESAYADYYGYPLYWTGPALWGAMAVPGPVPSPGAAATLAADARHEAEDAHHVRRISDVKGYHIAAADGEIGHVEDFMIDDADWSIQYLMIDTSNWIGGRTVLLPPDRVTRVEWTMALVHVDVTREAVKGSPEYDPGMDIDAGYRKRLNEAYRRPVRS